MGFWDVLLFCIASVLGPRWIAAAARNGQSSISLWILAAVLFFVPTAFIVVELSTRFPEEGGLYVWTKEAFGAFHGFVAGWTYWIYTVFYFPGLLLASAAMTAYVGGAGTAWLAESRTFLLVGSFAMLVVAVFLNIIGLHIGKWLQNAGGAGTYVPLTMIVGVALLLWSRQGSVTHFTLDAMLPHWNWDTVNFWPQLAFAFAGLELVSAMSEEVKNPQRTFPRAIFASGALIALMYIAGTVAVLMMLPSETVDPKSGVFQAMTQGATALRMAVVGVVAALLVTVGNAGGVRDRRWQESHAFRSLLGLTVTCPRHLERFIPGGKRPTFRFSCKPGFQASSCWSRKSTKTCAAPTRYWWTPRRFSISSRSFTCMPRPSNCMRVPTGAKTAWPSLSREEVRGYVSPVG